MPARSISLGLLALVAALGWAQAQPLIVSEDARHADRAEGLPGRPACIRRAELTRRELPAYRTANGVVPLVGTDQAARTDALTRVPEFLKQRLGD